MPVFLLLAWLAVTVGTFAYFGPGWGLMFAGLSLFLGALWSILAVGARAEDRFRRRHPHNPDGKQW